MMTPSLAGYRVVDHPADICFDVWGPDPEGLFVESARALQALLLPCCEAEEESESGGIEITARGVDREDLLVQWLGELLYHCESQPIVFLEYRILELEATVLRARCRHRPRALSEYHAMEIKAVTYHGLRITKKEGVYRARILLDV